MKLMNKNLKNTLFVLVISTSFSMLAFADDSLTIGTTSGATDIGANGVVIHNIDKDHVAVTTKITVGGVAYGDCTGEFYVSKGVPMCAGKPMPSLKSGAANTAPSTNPKYKAAPVPAPAADGAQ